MVRTGMEKRSNSRTIYTVDRHMSQVYVMTALNLIETWPHTTHSYSLTSKYSTTLCHDALYTSQACHPYSYSYSHCDVHSLD